MRHRFKTQSLAVLLLGLICHIHQSVTKEIIGFNCDVVDGAKYSEISLLNVDPCKNITPKYIEAEEVRMQVVQRRESENIETLHCTLKLSFATAFCGRDIAYTRVWNEVQSVTDQPVQVSKTQCTTAFVTKQLSFFDDGSYGSKQRSIKINLNDDFTAS